MDFPLTPGRAVAIAAVLDAHPRRLAHWADWSRDLRTWAEANAEPDDQDHAEVTPPTQTGPELEVLADAPSPPFDAAAFIAGMRERLLPHVEANR